MAHRDSPPRIPGAPFVPIILGVLLTIPGVSLLAAGHLGDDAPGRIGGYALGLATIGPILFVIGMCMIGPWVRLMRSTTAEQRRAMRAQAREWNRARRTVAKGR